MNLSAMSTCDFFLCRPREKPKIGFFVFEEEPSFIVLQVTWSRYIALYAAAHCILTATSNSVGGEAMAGGYDTAAGLGGG